MAPTPIPPMVRFLAKVDVVESGCWEWQGWRDRDGYGIFGVGARNTKRAHRFAYERLVGPIPVGLQIDHLCVNRCCVNPDHLEPVTAAENSARTTKALASHCARGHEFTEANTKTRDNGTRFCRECDRLRAVEYRRVRVA